MNKTILKGRQRIHRNALRYLSLTVFLLMTAPRLRITVAGIPFYVIDALIFLTWFHAMKLRGGTPSPMRSLVLFILAVAVASEMWTGVRTGELFQALYLAIRTALAVSLFFSAQRVVRTRRDLVTLLKAALPGVVISALLLITTSLPQTRGFVLHHIFSYSFLEPGGRGVIRRLVAYQEGGGRGRSLIGVSILTGAFLNTMWPLLLLLRGDAHLGRRWQALLISTLFLVPVAVTMTYSRGAILGLALVVLTSLLIARNVRRSVLFGVISAVLFFSWAGWNSPYFYFERITLTTRNALTNPYANHSLDERLFSYVEPFHHVVTHPSFLLIGEGLGHWRPWRFGLFETYNPADHSVFGAAYYTYGMLAAFAYIALLLLALHLTWQRAQRSQNAFPTQYAQALFAGLSGFLSWFLLGHAAVSQPRGAMLLFLVFGLVTSLDNFHLLSEDDEFTHQRAMIHKRGHLAGVRP